MSWDVLRGWISLCMYGLIVVAAVLVVLPLFLILAFLVVRGVSSVNLDFFTQLPRPVGEPGGGMANGIAGTFIINGLAAAAAIPIGIFGGVYLAESRHVRLPYLIRFTADVMTGVPSIAVGVFAYAVLVLPMRRFSALSGSFALGIIMLPIVMRTTEELIRLVPNSLREAGLALGLSEWKVILRVVMPVARSGIVTACMLAVARVAGETGPLLFTAFGNQFGFAGLDQPIAALPLQIFAYAISPYDDWHRQAWAGALVLLSMILVLSAAVRIVSRGRITQAR